MSGGHMGYIVAAYAFAAITVGGLILRAVLDHRAQQRALADFEARGVQRRSRRKAAQP
ncbi:heme exporter protein CcmD [Pseudochelatococcus lubricantis]